MDERIIALIGEEANLKIKSISVLIVGIGGVGGMAAEALVRSGIQNLTIIDKDKFEISNLNRQIMATNDTIKEYKTDSTLKRLKSINPNINITSHNIFLNAENINILKEYDYIIDACDTITTKILLIKYALKHQIKIISCMGTGKHLNPEELCITSLNKTYNCPLAKKMRNLLKKEGITTNIPVVFSKEIPLNKDEKISSMIFVPATAGLMLAYYVINDLIKK